MTTQEVRDQVLSAFNDETYYYSHVLPFGYTNFIDGLACVGLLCGAAYKVGDTEVAQKCERYLNRLLTVGKNARNFAPMPVSDSWIKSKTIPGYWYKEKPQSFAGPVGLRFAIDNGAHLNDPFQIKSKARLMACGGWAFGYLVRWMSWLRQHVNSMFLAYLILGKKPASSMMWLCEENPFFSYIAGEKCSVAYPDMNKVSDGHTEDRDYIVPLEKRKPSAWVFRGWPKSEYIREGVHQGSMYTPTAQLVGDYLQSTL
jgi:hypothetical protein